ncbi:hypothetical protein MAR_027712 [Mya arenaria]|uniref:Uncharacterized protein n=1 Tax=Mya arenaria TaxID=6604 RepID=A0ABY7EWA2_MYAAR|nr:hypothetical protein MAR_027712 [Mya arenaria]
MTVTVTKQIQAFKVIYKVHNFPAIIQAQQRAFIQLLCRMTTLLVCSLTTFM